MSAQAFGNGAASAAGSNLVNAVLTTLQGQAAVAATAAVVAAAPVVAAVVVGGAIGACVGCGGALAVTSSIDWLNS